MPLVNDVDQAHSEATMEDWARAMTPPQRQAQEAHERRLGPKIPLYQAIARKLTWEPTDAYSAQRIKELERLEKLLPSGSGWDMGTTLYVSESSPDCIVMRGSWHHMDDNGFYCGWTDHTIRVYADLADGFTVQVRGKDRNDIKAYIHDLFHDALQQLVDEWAPAQKESA